MEQVLALAAEYDMLPAGETVLCAVSGGADSMCLLDFLWNKQEKLGFSLAAAHFNHHLRGTASDGDQAFVAGWCRDRGIPLVLGGGEVAAVPGNLEGAARTLRYAFLQKTAGEIGAARIATAHNGDDNLETLLLNLTRGCGLHGLSGIPPRRGNIVRPLLTTSRGEIEAYLAQRHIPHVEDATNQDETYARNRIRRQVVPVLRGLNPRITQRSGETLALLRRDDDYLTAKARQAAEGARWVEGSLVLPAGDLGSLPDGVATRCVRYLFCQVGGDGLRLEACHLQSVLALARGRDPSGRAILPRGLSARRMYDLLLITREDPAPRPPFPPVPLQNGENPIEGTDFSVTLTGLTGPMTARPRQTGDKLRLPGRPPKSLKKLFIQEKIPRGLRDSIPVLADGDGVFAVAGLGGNADHPLWGTVNVFFTTQRATNKSEDG